MPFVIYSMIHYDASSKTLQGGVIDGLDQIFRNLFLVQQVTSRLLVQVCGIEVCTWFNKEIHDVGMVVQSGDVQGAVVVRVSDVHVGATLDQYGRDLQRREFTHGVAPYAGRVLVHSQMKGAEVILPPRMQLQKPVDSLLFEVVLF